MFFPGMTSSSIKLDILYWINIFTTIIYVVYAYCIHTLMTTLLLNPEFKNTYLLSFSCPGSCSWSHEWRHSQTVHRVSPVVYGWCIVWRLSSFPRWSCCVRRLCCSWSRNEACEGSECLLPQIPLSIPCHLPLADLSVGPQHGPWPMVFGP